jgi:hypothetical protein
MAKNVDALGESAATGGLASPFETKLVNLLALHLVVGKPQADQIDLLNRAGFRAGEIAALLDTTPNTVSVSLYQQKKDKKGPGKKGASKSKKKGA